MINPVPAFAEALVEVFDVDVSIVAGPPEEAPPGISAIIFPQSDVISRVDDDVTWCQWAFQVTVQVNRPRLNDPTQIFEWLTDDATRIYQATQGGIGVYISGDVAPLTLGGTVGLATIHTITLYTN